MIDPGKTSSPEAESGLKERIFAAFEHACRYGEVEVADQLLAIINSKWMRPSRTSPQSAMAGAPRQDMHGRSLGAIG